MMPQKLHKIQNFMKIFAVSLHVYICIFGHKSAFGHKVFTMMILYSVMYYLYQGNHIDIVFK